MELATRNQYIVMNEDDERFMQIALNEAEKAAEEGETPIGAVAVLNGKIIAKARNQKRNME